LIEKTNPIAPKKKKTPWRPNKFVKFGKVLMLTAALAQNKDNTSPID
jgi:hypothetical protein